jgi:hypothetical protein
MADLQRARGAARRAAVAAALLLAAALGGGCSTYRYYTQTTLQEYDLPPEAVKRIQFYLDAPLTLRFEKRVAESRVDEHEIDSRPYRLARTVEVVEDAGAEAVAIGEKWIKVRVAHDLVLEFRPSPTSHYGMYYLAAINDQVVEDRGTIYFRDNYYEVVFGTVDRYGAVAAGPHPRLRYKVHDVERTHREREEIDGIYLEDRERERRAQRDAGRKLGSGGE